MPNYEIMMILDPKAESKIAEEITKSVFASGLKKFEKMERTELAYEINKSKVAQYFLIDVNTEEENIKEFTRKCNIEKSIWRFLTINLDTEKGTKTLSKMPTQSIEEITAQMAEYSKRRRGGRFDKYKSNFRKPFIPKKTTSTSTPGATKSAADSSAAVKPAEKAE